MAGMVGFDLATNQNNRFVKATLRAPGGQSPLDFVVLHPSTHSQTKVKVPTTSRYFYFGWDGGIRTPECQDQNLVPYHLATSHYCYSWLLAKLMITDRF